MKPITILKRLITVFYYIFFIGIISKLIMTVTDIVSGQTSRLNPKVFGVKLEYANMSILQITVSLVIPFVLYYLIFQALIYLKNILEDLESGNYFNDLVISNLKKTGIVFIICSFGELTGKIIFFLILKSKFSLTIDISIMLFFIMGLFFMFLSEVFAKAKKIEQENDLTI